MMDGEQVGKHGRKFKKKRRALYGFNAGPLAPQKKKGGIVMLLKLGDAHYFSWACFNILYTLVCSLLYVCLSRV